MSGSFTYELSYEYDGEDFTGGISAFNLHGHGLDLDEIEQFLQERYDEDEIESGGWEIREDWLRKVPTRDGSMMHHYSRPGPGARAVTVLEQPRGWLYWCTNHPHEPAVVGRPAAQIIDGEALVARRLMVLAGEEDPRPDVDARGYVYLCRECGDDFTRRYADAQRVMSA